MTDRDLATCRDWCRANGLDVRPRGRGNAFEFTVYGGPDFIYKLALDYDGHTEQECYERIWMALAPIIQSVRNLDAVNVEGPYKVMRYDWSDKWHVISDNDGVECDTEQSARTIAAILNRECGK